eukprot:11185138-Alexandrium_andersonii.AAC.1
MMRSVPTSGCFQLAVGCLLAPCTSTLPCRASLPLRTHGGDCLSTLARSFRNVASRCAAGV